MTRWKSPQSNAEAGKIIEEAHDILYPKSVIRSDLDSEECQEVAKELAVFAGCFNHHITRQQRRTMIVMLSTMGEDAFDPVLEALVEIPRVEQFDVTKAFMRALLDDKE